MRALFHDLKFSMRMFAQRPAFSATATVTLTLGLGAATAMFTVVDTVLLRPLPYPHPERIVIVSSMYGGIDAGVTGAAQYRFLQEQSRDFESLAANDVVPSAVNLSGRGEPEQVARALVSSDFFQVLGVTPALGRVFTPEEDRPGSGCVVILTDGLWRARYNGDHSIIGGLITVDGESCSVVGVLPPTFRFHLNALLLMPIRIAAVPRDLGHYYTVMARLKPGVTIDQARAELKALFARFKAAHPDLIDDGEVGLQAELYRDKIVGDVRRALWMLLSAVSLVLLIACVNVANLLASRAMARSKEMAVRAALGATRLRLVRQLITECALLAFAGGASGLLLAYLGIPMLLHLAPSGLPRATDISVDPLVVAFVFLVSAASVLVFGVAPAMLASRVDLNIGLKAPGRRTAAGSGRPVSSRFFIGTEVALSVILLTGSVLLMRSFLRLQTVAPGFDAGGVLTFKMSIPARYGSTTRMWEFEREALARINTLPGVQAATSATCLPLEIGPDMPTVVIGQVPAAVLNPAYRPVSPDYFRTLGIPLVRRRFFVESDRQKSTPVTILNASSARQIFQDRDPIGQRLQLGVGLGMEYADAPREIVGVVGDVRETSLEKAAQITVFIPRAQIPDAENALINRLLPMSWAVRTKLPPANLAKAIRQTILSVDPQQPVAAMRTMEQALSTSVDRQRFTLLLMAIFASLAVVMAAVGVYGVVNYHVRQRERELGIRLALGAAPRALCSHGGGPGDQADRRRRHRGAIRVVCPCESHSINSV